MTSLTNYSENCCFVLTLPLRCLQDQPCVADTLMCFPESPLKTGFQLWGCAASTYRVCLSYRGQPCWNSCPSQCEKREEKSGNFYLMHDNWRSSLIMPISQFDFFLCPILLSLPYFHRCLPLITIYIQNSVLLPAFRSPNCLTCYLSRLKRNSSYY